MKINSLLKDYARELEDVSLRPHEEAEEICMSVLSLKSKSDLYTSEVDFDFTFQNKVSSVLSFRKQNVPLQYLLPDVNFYGLNFAVKEGVFIPRPETEIVVEYILKNFSGEGNLKILEIGTGSGIISICLTKNLAQCRIVATDISSYAISQACKNAVLNDCRADISFIRGNLFDFLKEKRCFDLIVSNPPYIGQRDFESLSEEVKKEPHVALFGGEEGFEFSLKLIESGGNYIKENGKIVLEIDPRHRKMYQDCLSAEYKIEFIKDLQNKDRVMIVELNNG
ncbi:MAG: peptide chain release factor N(5)-glutamine methyltransferase [Candidatus Saelkia tenebricola]|nr:peptide chain release factor N(5)-glutamine methyltransferase [Candidatus Saelkia tenebricola]